MALLEMHLNKIINKMTGSFRWIFHESLSPLLCCLTLVIFMCASGHKSIVYSAFIIHGDKMVHRGRRTVLVLHYCSDIERQRHEVRYFPLYKFRYAFPSCRKLCFPYLCIYLLSLDKQRSWQFVDSQREDCIL